MQTDHVAKRACLGTCVDAGDRHASDASSPLGEGRIHSGVL